MPTPIPLTDCPGLIDLMLTGDEHGPSFTLNGALCSADWLSDHHGKFEAVTPDFGLSVIYPGWYAGQHGMPVHLLIVGDIQACLQWLPLDRADKCALIGSLPLDAIDETIFKLAI